MARKAKSNVLQFPIVGREEREARREEIGNILAKLFSPDKRTAFERLQSDSARLVSYLNETFGNTKLYGALDEALKRERLSLEWLTIASFFDQLDLLVSEASKDDVNSVTLSLGRISAAFRDLAQGVQPPFLTALKDQSSHPKPGSVREVRAYVVCALNLLERSGLKRKEADNLVIKKYRMLGSLAKDGRLTDAALKGWRDEFNNGRGKRDGATKLFEDENKQIALALPHMTDGEKRDAAEDLLSECALRAAFMIL